jgi:hypothetical protein
MGPGPNGSEFGGLPEPPEMPVSGWWWQVLGADSREPVMGNGRADRGPLARHLAETQMEACEGAIVGMVLGPGGVLHRCRRTVDGSVRWLE